MRGVFLIMGGMVVGALTLALVAIPAKNPDAFVAGLATGLMWAIDAAMLILLIVFALKKSTQ